jgi:hypothetical protein
VQLLAHASGGAFGVGLTPEGEPPPGMAFEPGPRLVGVPTVEGTYEVAIRSVAHSVPPGCPGVSYVAWFSIAVRDASSQGEGSGSSTDGATSD